MKVRHCPTEQMIADFYTKPIQGKQFCKLRNVIMGHDTMPAEECVGTSDKITTGMSTNKQVSRKKSKISTNYGYRISNNFK